MLSSGDSFPHLIQKRRSQLGFVTYLLNYPRSKQLTMFQSSCCPLLQGTFHILGLLRYWWQTQQAPPDAGYIPIGKMLYPTPRLQYSLVTAWMVIPALNYFNNYFTLLTWDVINLHSIFLPFKHSKIFTYKTLFMLHVCYDHNNC